MPASASTYADTRLNGNAPAPVELLEVDRTAVFTFPDTTENRLAFVQGRANVATSAAWSVQVTGYYRDLDRRTLNGDEAEFSVCDDPALPAGAPGQTLCFGGNDDEGNDDDAGAAPLIDVRSGRFITSLAAAGDAAFNRTTTRAQGYGAALQATATTAGGARDNVLVLGASADLADVAFASNSEVGTLTAERGVAGSGLLAGIHGLGGDDLFNTGIETANQGVGLYFSDTLSVTGRAHLTVSGRYNRARLDIADQLGTSPRRHAHLRTLQPGRRRGLPGRAAECHSSRGTSESNRAPTVAELSCADPAEPCRVPNAFVSDPPLDQAVARSVETGIRGRWAAGSGRGEWSVSAYRTRIDDDILFIASPDLIGTGYFQNAGATARAGLDVELSGRFARTRWYASYGRVEATFASPLRLPSDDAVNDAAREDGTIAVEPGDRLPGIPRHSLKTGLRRGLTDALDIAVETVVASEPDLRRGRRQRPDRARRLRGGEPPFVVSLRQRRRVVRARGEPLGRALRDERRAGRDRGPFERGAGRQRSAVRRTGPAAKRLRGRASQVLIAVPTGSDCQADAVTGYAAGAVESRWPGVARPVNRDRGRATRRHIPRPAPIPPAASDARQRQQHVGVTRVAPVRLVERRLGVGEAPEPLERPARGCRRRGRAPGSG